VVGKENRHDDLGNGRGAGPLHDTGKKNEATFMEKRMSLSKKQKGKEVAESLKKREKKKAQFREERKHPA